MADAEFDQWLKSMDAPEATPGAAPVTVEPSPTGKDVSRVTEEPTSDQEIHDWLASHPAPTSPEELAATKAQQLPGVDIGPTQAYWGGLERGIPFVGRGLEKASQYGAAGAEALVGQGPFSKQLGEIERASKKTEAMHPSAAGWGKATGEITGSGLAMYVAPWTFGLEAGIGAGGVQTLLAMGKGAATNAFMSTTSSLIDSYMDGDTPEIAAQKAKRAGVIAGVTGAAGPLLLKGAGWFFANRVEPYVAKLGVVAQEEGVPLTAEMVSDNKFLKLLGSLPLGGFGREGAMKAAEDGLTRAVVRQMGENSDRLTGDVISATLKRAGPAIDRIAGQGGDVPLTDVVQDLGGLWNEIQNPAARAMGKETQQSARALLTDVAEMFDRSGGKLTSKQYKELMRHDGLIDKAKASSDPDHAFVAKEIEKIIDKAWEANSPADVVAAMKKAKYQYWIAKTVQPLAERFVGGRIPGAEWAGRLAAKTEDYGVGTGSRFEDLAKLGQMLVVRAPKAKTALQHLGAEGIAGVIGKGGEFAAPLAEMAGIKLPSVLGLPGVAIGAPTVGALGNVATRSATLGNALVNAGVGRPAQSAVESILRTGGRILPEMGKTTFLPGGQALIGREIDQRLPPPTGGQ